jgi:RNA-directed DNA polymerase
VNTGVLWPDPDMAWLRVLKIQTKLHRWATDDPDRRFDDLYNLVYDPAVLVDAWQRVKGNRGARSAGVDGQTAYYIKAIRGEQVFLSELRDELKARSFQPAPVREVMIPKPGGKRRRLGIATVKDRVVQAALKTVLEPIFEADFQPCSYGFRPGRRAQDAIAEIHYLTSRSYQWVVEGDIKACFDEISHSALLQRMRGRIGDRRVLGLVRAFLKSGILGEDAELRESTTGAPQGGILSPLLSNIALSVLDEHFVQAWQAMGDSHAREYRRRKGLANYRLVRYADDCVTRTLRRNRCRRSRLPMWCCARDGGWPSGIALQGEVPNHRKLLRSRAVVVSVAETAGLSPSGVSREGERKRTIR